MVDSVVDVAIVGGGISGLGAARAIVDAGFSVMLLESQSVCAATSANSLRIMHGGFRYLQSLDVGRTLQSMRDQSALLDQFPDIIRPLRCLMALSGTGLKRREFASVGAYLFRALGSITGSCRVTGPRVVPRSSVQDLSYFGSVHGLPYVLEWHDALLEDPSELSKRLVAQCVSRGVDVREHSPVASIQCSRSGGYLTLASGEQLRSRVVVLTLGQSTNSVKTTIDGRVLHTAGDSCVALNLIFTRRLIEADVAVGIESMDRRLFFLVPRGKGTAVGTWYAPMVQGTDPAEVAQSEISKFLSAFGAAFHGPGAEVRDIEKVEWGVLPRDSRAGNVMPLGHERIVVDGTCVTVVSTKYTTFRSQGEKVRAAVERILPR